MALGVPGRLRPRIISTFSTIRVVGRQPYAPAAFTPGEIPGTHFQRLSQPQGTWFCLKEPQKKSPVTTLGINHGTVWLVAQCLNHYATPSPYIYIYIYEHALYSGVNLSYICGTRIDDELFHSGNCCLVSWSHPQKHISSPTITFKWNSGSLSSLLKVLAFIDTTVILLFTQQIEHKFGSNPKHVQAVFQNALNQPK